MSIETWIYFLLKEISLEEVIRRNVPINYEKAIPFVTTKSEACPLKVKKPEHGNEKGQNVTTRSKKATSR